jgi:hypothetical protein
VAEFFCLIDKQRNEAGQFALSCNLCGLIYFITIIFPLQYKNQIALPTSSSSSSSSSSA